MRVAGYVRVSSRSQVEEGWSLDGQQRIVGEYCTARGWDLVHVYVEAGRSARWMKGRGELHALLEAAGRHDFTQVVVIKLDRAFRNLKEMLQVADELAASGAGLLSITEMFDTATAAGRLHRNILGSVAEWERDAIGERIVFGYEEKARQGGLARLSLGYVRDAAGGAVPDPAVAPLIREAYERYATGEVSLNDLVRWAGGAGLRSGRGNVLDRLAIRKLLTNIVYRGQVGRYTRSHQRKAVYEGKHPPIVDPNLFERVQQQLARRATRLQPERPYGRQPYPLSGVTICEYDGAPMLGLRSGPGLRYMRCSTAQRQGAAACPQPMVAADVLERQVGAYVSTMQIPDDLLADVASELHSRSGDRKPALDAPRLQREIDRWQRLFVLGEIDEAAYRHETAPLHRQLTAAQAAGPAFSVERAVGYLRDMGKAWDMLDAATRRKFVVGVFSELRVQGAQLTAITVKAEWVPLFAVDRNVRFGGELCLVGSPSVSLRACCGGSLRCGYPVWRSGLRSFGPPRAGCAGWRRVTGRR